MAAADQGALFEQEETFTVGQVTTRLARAVAASFPGEVWVRGEVQELRPPNANGHVYLSLCEKARGRDTATLAVALFRQSRVRVERTLAEHPGFRLADGLEVRVRGRVQYAYGRIQLVVSEIDPVHTLGRLAAERDRVVAALRADGLLDRNARVRVPLAPLRVAVVTSDGSAACSDVLHELEASGIGFRVAVADARVQGQGAEASVLAGLARAVASRPDVVLLVRGGGSRTDLATFDRERIARAIAAVPVPVLTGIGHETDASVADAVAAASFKTPTACAAAVVEQVRTAADRAEAAWTETGRRAHLAERRAGERLDARARRLVSRASTAVAAAQAMVAAHAQRANHLAVLRLAGAESALVDAGRRTGRAAPAVVDAAADRVDGALGRLDPARLAGALRSRDGHLDSAVARLHRASVTTTAGSASTIDVLAARVGALDPARALARGWSITRTSDGGLVRSTADVVPGDALVTTLLDGTVASTAGAVTSHPATEAESRP